MNIINILILIFAIVPATSYGWGMRGTTIGGEKGAMLPGALIGLIIAMCSDILIVRENAFVFAALGAVSMYVGGSMTYGETLGLSMNNDANKNIKKGLEGVFLKGFLWFGVFGGMFSLGINMISGIYTDLETVVYLCLLPACSVAFYFLINKPHSVEKKKFPKLYFSVKRQESWGALAGIFIFLILSLIYKFDALLLTFLTIPALFGGVGWLIGQLLQIYFIHHAQKSSNAFIKRLCTSGVIETWKLMECVLGAFGGLGCAIAFILSYDNFSVNVHGMEKLGGIRSTNETAVLIIFVIWLILICADMVHYFIKKPTTRSELKKRLKNKEITKKEYNLQMKSAVKDIPPKLRYYFKATEIAEPILYSAIPFSLICLGSEKASYITAFFILLLVILQEIALEKIIPKISQKKLIVASAFILLITFAFQFIIGTKISATLCIVLYLPVYELLTLLYLLPEEILKSPYRKEIRENTSNKIVAYIKIILKNKMLVMVHTYFVIAILITLSVLF